MSRATTEPGTCPECGAPVVRAERRLIASAWEVDECSADRSHEVGGHRVCVERPPRPPTYVTVGRRRLAR